MANIGQPLLARIQEIIAPVIQGDRFIDRDITTPVERKLYLGKLTLIQKQLRALKAEISVTKKEVRANFANREANVGQHPILGMLIGKKNASHMSAQQKNLLRSQANDAIRPYDHALQVITRYLLAIDEMKLRIQQLQLEA